MANVSVHPDSTILPLTVAAYCMITAFDYVLKHKVTAESSVDTFQGSSVSVRFSCTTTFWLARRRSFFAEGSVQETSVASVYSLPGLAFRFPAPWTMLEGPYLLW